MDDCKMKIEITACDANLLKVETYNGEPHLQKINKYIKITLLLKGLLFFFLIYFTLCVNQ